MTKTYFTWEDVNRGIDSFIQNFNFGGIELILGISRGGLVPATLLSQKTNIPMKAVDPFSDVSEFVDKKVLIVDDIYDSGRTLKYFKDHLPKSEQFVLVTKEDKDSWIVFPWETEEDKTDGLEQSTVTLLRASGDDPTREGLLETPSRFAKAWRFLTNGYKENPKSVMKVFENPGMDQLVVVSNIDFYSLCEHHLAPFYGQVHVGYLPNGKVLGVSKFARLTEIFARRLQIQERLTQEIAETIMNELQPRGVGVVVEAVHLCMRSRGVQKQNASMKTSVMLGDFRTNESLKQEFLAQIARKGN